MDDPLYLLSVVETIAESLYHDIRSSTSIHILLDAYATFVNRVRSLSQPLETSDAQLPALIALTPHKDNFIRALRRDIRLAHSDPFSYHRSSLDETSIYLNIKTDTMQYARDSSLICHYALCAVTTIFRFPAFYSVFPEHDLSLLFGDVLDIALAEQLPVLNEAKTYSLSLWALGSHRLPVTVIDSRRDGIFSALQRNLDCATRPSNIVLDGLKATSHTVERHSAVLDLLSPLLPHVMANLNRKSSEHRLHASIALGKFANALIHQSELSLERWQSLSNHLTFFLESCCDQSQVALGDTNLSCLVRNAFSTESHAGRADDPVWILAVLASLIVLCGPTLYRKSSVLHFILRSLAMALTHKRSIVRALHPHVWRCFVWTFNQMLLSSKQVDPTLISSAFYVIKQEVSGGIGVTLASVLLSDEHSDKVSEALSVIEAMVRTECKHTRREGFMFLQALTNDTRVRQQILQDMYEIPATVLFNGTIACAEWDSLPSAIHSIPKVPISVRWPEQTEVIRHYKTLLVIWKHLASKGDRKHLDSGLVDVWLSILLACARQLEYGQHFTAIIETLRYIAATIVEFLPSLASGDYQPDWGSWDVNEQLSCLTFIDQLWSAMRKAFVSLSLADVAEFILASVLQYAFHVLDVGVRALWGKLCANLMTIAPPSFLRDTVSQKSKLVIRSQRELWGVVATSLSSSDLGLDWTELVQFLAIPICTWALSEPELEAWEALLRDAIAVSGDPPMVIRHIVLQYFQGKDVENWDSIIAILGFLLTSAHGGSPSGELLNTVDICLAACYYRAQSSSEVLTYSLKLLDDIRQVIVSAPGDVMHILQALRSSLCLWIADHTEVMSDDQFNSVAISLYCQVLKALEILPLSIQSLQDTEHFIASAFSRIPAPAVAPFAFEKFWRATYHGQARFCNNLPPKIKFCLSCFTAAYGSDLADGVSLTTESQSQSISNESQVRFLTIHQHQDVSEFDFLVSLSSASTNANAEAWTDMQVTPHERQHMFTTQHDAIFHIPSLGDDVSQPTVLRQLQEYTSRIEVSSVDESERSMGSPGTPPSPIFSPNHVMGTFYSAEEIHPVTSHVPNQKRKHANDDDAPQKRSRTSRGILRSVRKLESEPATRDLTPVDVPPGRMNSVPLRKRRVFDGVEVPTFREVSRRKMVQRTETGLNTTGEDFVSIPKTPSPCTTRGRCGTPQSVFLPSDEDGLDWENLRIDGTSSETDVDRSLANAIFSSPPPTEASPPHHSDAPLGFGSQKAVSQSEGSSSVFAHPSLQRPKTASSRLDALRDVYSSVENGGSQISLPELMQATTLVHQIGAALTAKMKNKMDKMDNKDDPRRP